LIHVRQTSQGAKLTWTSDLGSDLRPPVQGRRLATLALHQPTLEFLHSHTLREGKTVNEGDERGILVIQREHTSPSVEFSDQLR